ncbi:MAG: hypothetical protein II700_01070 [Firmicutes bacterium]|nr:hypothetical protein [Bacillota bacterium]
MDQFYEYERDRIFMGLHNPAVNHQQGVNGKVAGNLEAFAQIKDAAVLLHGPKGCAFHYRYYSRRRWLPFYGLESDDLTEAEVISGGEQKLFDAALRLAERRPGLIVLIPTVASDIMQCDLLGIAGLVRERTGIPCVAVKSEVFSHIDKTVMRRGRREALKGWCSGKVSKNTDSRGCGFSEAMLTLAEQLMEPQEETDPRGINVEGYSWGYGGRMLLKGMNGMLADMGLHLRTVIPSCAAAEIAKAPAAGLDIARRVRWAMALERSFGIPYIHVHGFARYTGLDGIRLFYRDINEKMGLGLDTDRIFEARFRAAEERLAGVREAYRGKRILLIARTFANLPNQLVQAVKGAGIPVTCAAAFADPELLERGDYDSDMIETIKRNTARAAEMCGLKEAPVIGPDPQQFRELTDSADIIIADPRTQLLWPGKPVLSDDLLFVAPLDPEGFCKNAEYIAKSLGDLPVSGSLLINRVPFAPGLYPQTDRPSVKAAGEIWQKLWQDRGRDA